MAVDLNANFRQIVQQRAAAEGPDAYQMELAAIARGDAERAANPTAYGNDMVAYAAQQATNPGIGFDTEKTPIITFLIIAAAAYFLFKK